MRTCAEIPNYLYLVICANNPALEDQNLYYEYLRTYADYTHASMRHLLICLVLLFCIQHWYLGFVYNTGSWVLYTTLVLFVLYMTLVSGFGQYLFIITLNTLVFTLILLYLMYVQQYTQYYDFVIIKYYSIKKKKKKKKKKINDFGKQSLPLRIYANP